MLNDYCMCDIACGMPGATQHTTMCFDYAVVDKDNLLSLFNYKYKVKQLDCLLRNFNQAEISAI